MIYTLKSEDNLNVHQLMKFFYFIEDIMYEVFRAMKFLNFEWKLLNAYHVVVRRKPKDADTETVFKI